MGIWNEIGAVTWNGTTGWRKMWTRCKRKSTTEVNDKKKTGLENEALR
jgi:hypothetical protein